ncbi:TetR/AcrR family transcriptional regulator [Gordonia araii NBRC 100433]|nr:TetR/AcrR family transcriptional regulator [Gordonia araii NBRC 100433]
MDRMSEDDAGRPPGRPLEVDISRRVNDAVLQLLADKGYHGLSISDVAKLAGVPRSTLYRRRETTATLSVQAISAVVPAVHDIDSGQPLDDLVASITDFVRRFTACEHTPVVMELHALALRDQELARLTAAYLRPRGEILDRMIARAQAAGVINPDIASGVVRDLLIGPLFYRWLVPKQALDESVVETIVAGALRGVAPP